MKKILIAIDGGPTSEKICLAALKLVNQQMNPEIALLSVADTEFIITDGNVTPNELIQITKNDLKESHKILIDKVFNNHKIWTFIEEGHPDQVILKVAEEWDADIIVIGTHGRTGLKHLLMGSVAEKVIRHALKPLFIVPAK